MKKIFFLAAAVVAAMAMNAAGFTGFDGRDGDLGVQIRDNGLIQNTVNYNLVEDEAATPKYKIQNVAGGEATTFTMGGISFYASDANAAKDLWKTYGTYIQPNGARRTITIPTTPGDKVLIYVQDACTGLKAEGVAEGAAIDFVGSGTGKDVANTLTATGLNIVIYSNDEGGSTAIKPKYQAILPAGATGLEGVRANAALKANKMIVNGRMYVRNAHNAWVNVLGF
ncbi:MAG: hypothetical protein MJZ75_05940 [Paludibacteraceae bacterium]|nr:hypothetical protein [Paludibacteraceae bacterium]